MIKGKIGITFNLATKDKYVIFSMKWINYLSINITGITVMWHSTTVTSR